MNLSDKQIVADYLVKKMSEKEIESLASLLKDETCILSGDLIKVDNGEFPIYQTVSIARSGWTGSVLINNYPNSPYTL